MSKAADFERAIEEAEAFLNEEHRDGYFDGRDLSNPEPNANRSEAYRHSFDVARAEKMGKPRLAVESRARANGIRTVEITKRLEMLAL